MQKSLSISRFLGERLIKQPNYSPELYQEGFKRDFELHL
jgi:hypothetical protein